MRSIGKIYFRNLKNSRNLNLNISICRDRSLDLRSRWKRRIKMGMDGMGRPFTDSEGVGSGAVQRIGMDKIILNRL